MLVRCLFCTKLSYYYESLKLRISLHALHSCGPVLALFLGVITKRNVYGECEMRKLFVFLLVLLILGGASYTGFWFYTANYAKSIIQKQFELDAETITSYESIEVTGFPLNYQFEIKNIDFTLTSEMLDRMKDEQDEEVNHDMKEWSIHSRLEGSMVINGDFMLKEFDIKYLGDYDISITVDDLTREFTSTHNQSDSTFYLELVKPVFLINGIYTDITSIEEHVQTIEQSFYDMKLMPKGSQDTIFQLEKSYVKLKQNDRDLEAMISLENGEFLSNANEVFHEILTAFSPEKEKLPLLLTERGKINGKFELVFDQPDGAGAILDKKLDVGLTKLNIKHLNYSDDLFLFESNCLIAAEVEQPNARPSNVKLSLYTKFNVSEELYKLGNSALNRSLESSPIAMMAIQSAPLDTGGMEAITEGKSELNLLPKIHEFGDIVFEIDIDIDDNKAEKTYRTDIRKLNFVTEKYGVTLEGNLNSNEKSTIPSYGKLTLGLLNYDTLMDDLWSFIKNVNHSVGSLKQEEDDGYKKRAIEFTEDKIQALKSFLKSISDEPESNGNDLTITILKEPDSERLPKVGTMPGEQVMMLYMTQLAPVFQLPPLEEGYYHCKCKQVQCLIINKRTFESEMFEANVIHYNIPLADVLTKYDPDSKGMLKTGWQCKFVGSSAVDVTNDGEAEIDSNQPEAAVDGEKEEPAASTQTSATLMPESLKPDKAVSLFNQYLAGAESGSARDQYNLAILYGKGVGTEKDSSKMLYWLQKAADGGNKRASKILNKLKNNADKSAETKEETDSPEIE